MCIMLTTRKDTKSINKEKIKKTYFLILNHTTHLLRISFHIIYFFSINLNHLTQNLRYKFLIHENQFLYTLISTTT